MNDIGMEGGHAIPPQAPCFFFFLFRVYDGCVAGRNAGTARHSPRGDRLWFGRFVQICGGLKHLFLAPIYL